MSKSTNGFKVDSLPYRASVFKRRMEADRFPISLQECADVMACGFGYQDFASMSQHAYTPSKRFSIRKAMKKMEEYISDDKKDIEDAQRVIEISFAFTHLVK